jgi:signal transduction histidine kinase
VSVFLQKLFLSWRGSTLQLIAAIVIPLTLLLVGISFGSFFIHQNAMRAMVGERDERAVRAAATIVDSEIQRRIDFVRGLAVLTPSSNHDNIEFAYQQSAYGSGLFDIGLMLAFENGAKYILGGDELFWDAILLQSEGAVVSSILFEERPVVLITHHAPENGLTAVGAFSPDKLLENVLQNDFPAHGHTDVYVFDQSYQVLYQNSNRTLESDSRDHPGVAEGLAGQSGATYVQTRGDEHVIAYSFVPSTGWAIVIEESWEMVASPTLQTTLVTPLILVPALLLALLALWFGAEQIVKPLRLLESKAARLAWGEFEEIEKPVKGIAEIRHLQNELIHMARQVQAAQQSLHSYIDAITRGQEEERLRLARELHDDTIQSLIALKQRAQLTRRALPKDVPLPSVDELEDLTEQTIQNLRRTIRALRPIYLEDFGLTSALEILLKETGQAAGLEIAFLHTGVERRLAPDVELALYRMVQEALNNTAHHAQAKKASISVEFAPESVRICINDDGVGFTPPASPAEFVPDGHFGLVGLYERAQLLGAKLEIQSAQKKGTQVVILLQDRLAEKKQ